MADVACEENLAEGTEKGEGFPRGTEVRFGNDLHQGGASSVEIDSAAIFKVERFGNIFFQMDAGEANRASCFGFGGVLDFFGKKEGIEGD